ncbi:MAG: hypothetical protein D6707_10435, partial [Bacteroidetes bacterium]
MKNKKILLSFVGSNDAGKLLGDKDGAILTALQNEKFDEVILLWNESEVKGKGIKYSEIVTHLKREIKKRNLVPQKNDEELFIKDVTDHNEIYIKLKDFTDTLPKNDGIQYTAAISSGTPAMQVCWILLAESGDFAEKNSLRLIKVKDPRYGKSGNVEVKLNTSLPKIVRLRREVDKLKGDLIPSCRINIRTGKIFIGDIEIELSPMQFAYYRYFVQRVLDNKGMEKFAGYFAPRHFLVAIHRYHEESFPHLDTHRQELLNLIKKEGELVLSNVRPNITKLNKRLLMALGNDSIFEQY